MIIIIGLYVTGWMTQIFWAFTVIIAVKLAVMVYETI